MEHSLLKLLIANQNNWLALDAIKASLSLSPQKIVDQIDSLTRKGYTIESSPTYGFRLTGDTFKLTSELIEEGLATRRVGRSVLAYQTTDSTNDVAWHYALESAPGPISSNYDGLVIVAEQQRSGRGRLGRQWVAPQGSSVLCSVLLMNTTDALTRSSAGGQALTLLAGLSVAEAIETVFHIKPRIKWPNDVIVNGKKIAGVMVESRKIKQNTAYVIGMGINCLQTAEDFPPECRGNAISLRQIIGTPVNRLELTQVLLRRMDDWLAETSTGQPHGLHDAWAARCDNINCRLSVVSNGQTFTGRVVDVNVEEGLIMQLDNGPIKVFNSTTTTVKIP
ncbi:MAG: biotin--[acetyl-CoA-carboxylase] ligase [Phycisphaerae bacterium]|nr:biotin--[acetyl-CoA-carboxylase] ligase [Phycisphaerae bacterium]